MNAAAYIKLTQNNCNIYSIKGVNGVLKIKPFWSPFHHKRSLTFPDLDPYFFTCFLEMI